MSLQRLVGAFACVTVNSCMQEQYLECVQHKAVAQTQKMHELSCKANL